MHMDSMRGTHLIIEATCSSRKTLDNAKKIEGALASGAEAAGFRVVKLAHHSFKPHGVSAFAMLSESHFSIHTWPESNYAALDIFTCGKRNPKAAWSTVKRILRLREVSIKEVKRGI